MTDRSKSALNVMDGIEQPGRINDDLIRKLKSRKGKALSVSDYLQGIFSGNRTVLGQAITLIESSLARDQEKAQEIIAQCLVEKHKSSIKNQSGKTQTGTLSHSLSDSGAPSLFTGIRVGITGVPGAGKSTFIEALGTHLTSAGHKLAVLAIDPSSTRSRGSILGDKTRMEELSANPCAFIRPSPSAGSLGGVARKTRETIILCEAAGYDVILVETVGVGQSETAVYSMVDFFLLLMIAGAGDELQGIKRGIIEMADAIFINKADGDNLLRAKAARTEFAGALHLFPPPASGWTPVVDICSAKTKTGIEEAWKVILEHNLCTKTNGYFLKRRTEQDLQVFSEAIEADLRQHFYARKEIRQLMEEKRKEICAGQVNPYAAAQEVLTRFQDSRG